MYIAPDAATETDFFEFGGSNADGSRFMSQKKSLSIKMFVPSIAAGVESKTIMSERANSFSDLRESPKSV